MDKGLEKTSQERNEADSQLAGASIRRARKDNRGAHRPVSPPLLRIADGLDRTHLGFVEDLDCEILPDKVIVHIKASNFSDTDKTKGEAKADLFEKVFEKEAVIDWVSE